MDSLPVLSDGDRLNAFELRVSGADIGVYTVGLRFSLHRRGEPVECQLDIPVAMSDGHVKPGDVPLAPYELLHRRLPAHLLKLQEALYFWRSLNTSWNREPLIAFNLSALSNAIYGVLEAFELACRRSETERKWWKQSKEVLFSNQAFNALYNFRIRSTHQGRTDSEGRVAIVVADRADGKYAVAPFNIESQMQAGKLRNLKEDTDQAMWLLLQTALKGLDRGLVGPPAVDPGVQVVLRFFFQDGSVWKDGRRGIEEGEIVSRTIATHLDSLTPVEFGPEVQPQASEDR